MVLAMEKLPTTFLNGKFKPFSYKTEKKFLGRQYIHFQGLHDVLYKNDQAVIKQSDEEWSVDWDFFKNHFKAGFPLKNANKLIHAQVFFRQNKSNSCHKNISDNRRSNICTYAENLKANHGNAI